MNEQHRLAYRAIKEVSYQHHGAITKLLAILGVSRQYNKSFKRVETQWENHDRLLKQRIQYWFDFHYQGIGAGNLLINLEQDEQITFMVTSKQVRRVMRALNIRCQIRTKKHDRIESNSQSNILRIIFLNRILPFSTLIRFGYLIQQKSLMGSTVSIR